MDVRCEKCKTEYEFDDARISEAGVTVKCTSCGHVFKVKKRALVVTVPVRPGEVDAPSLAAAIASPAPEKQREWKVRQASGNLFTFKELTTLQKWIVERKVSRDDEISLTGESWKRLGNIAELASFFQVVDEAQRAQLPQVPLGNAYPLPSVPAPQPQPLGIGPVPPSGSFSVPPPSALRRQMEPLPMEVDDDLRKAGVKGGGLKWLLIILVLAALGGGGYYGYFYWWLPQQQHQAELEKQRLEAAVKAQADSDAALAKAKDDAAKAGTEKDKDNDKRDADAKAKALAEAEAAKADAGRGDAGAAAVVKKEPPHDFDWFMSRGDRLREADHASAALEAYARASELQPDRAEPIAGKGLALLDLGNHGQAETAFQKALSLNPRYGVAIMGLAETYRASGRKDDAVRFYQKYLDELPDGPEASVARNAIQKLQE